MNEQEQFLISYAIKHLTTDHSVEEVQNYLIQRGVHVKFIQLVKAIEFVASQLLWGYPASVIQPYLVQQQGYDAECIQYMIDQLLENNLYLSDRPYQELPGIAQAQLLVLGDSHSLFWSGEEEISVFRKGRDRLPGVVTTMVGSPLAWNLTEMNSTLRGREKTLLRIHSALSHGFRGWIMLSFGEVDIRWHILRSAARIGLAKAVGDCVDRYVAFIHELKQLHDKIAVWGPVASTNGAYTESFPAIGSVEERNYATLLFTALLQQNSGVPVLSVLASTILDNGRTNADLFFDGAHLSQKMLPYALDLAHHKLGLNISGGADVPGFLLQDISDRVVMSENVLCEGRNCVRCDMQKFPVHIVSFDLIGPARYDTTNPLSVFLSNDQKSIYTKPLMPKTGLLQIGEAQKWTLTINQTARFLYIPYSLLGKPTVRINAMVHFLGMAAIKDHLSHTAMRNMVQAYLD
ncbi:MAG: hypothetical protein HQL80_10220 [Magnetococcales bacterium]|nr:hypothetical protein [Magnetococcales bacterium]